MQEKICVAFLLFLALATPADAAQLGRTTSQVNFREGPNRSARVISVLSPGTEVAILREDSGSWYQVTHHGRTGLRAQKLRRLATASESSKSVRLEEKQSG